ncbi:MAG: hypothetical protein AAF570_16570, partial [Bacteroidota bacterium]
AVRHLQNETALRTLYDQMFLITQEELAAPSTDNLHKAEQLIRQMEAQLSDHTGRRSFMTQLNYHFIYNFYHHLNHDHAAALQHTAEIVALWEASPAQIRDNRRGYIHAMVDYLNSCHKAGQYDGFLEVIQKIRALKGLSSELQARTFRATWNLEMIYYMNSGQFEAALGLIPVFEDAMERFAGRIDQISIFSYSFNIAILLFLMERFREALRWVNRLREYEKSDVRRDVQRFVRLLNLMTHLELGNDGLLVHFVPNTRRIMRQTGPLNPLEKALLRFLGKLPDLPARNRTAAFAQFHQQLDAIEGNVLGLQETRIWAGSRAEGTAMRERL